MIATWKMSLEGVRKADDILKCEDDRRHALAEAIMDVENNPAYHYVGYGGYPNMDGEVETDASYMDGNTMKFGAVAGMKGIANPILVAMKLSENTKDIFLCGEGAKRYALENGFDENEMSSPEAKAFYEEHCPSFEAHDTVCMIAMDSKGLSTGVSTSGLPFKHAGRVGDSPVIGSGFYCDSETGAACATGNGEDVMRGSLCLHVVMNMKQGMDVQPAVETALFNHIERLERAGYRTGDISVIAMDNKGNRGVATNREDFPFVVCDENTEPVVMVCHNRNSQMVIDLPNEEWLSSYTGD